jgi:transposase-like protein
MGSNRRKYSKELKVELVERVLAGRGTLEVARDEGISPSLIKKWKKEYMDGKFHGTSATDSELRKLGAKNSELEQMVGKLTIEIYLLKKEKEYLAQMRKESLSPISGPNSNQSGRWQK